MALEKLHQLLQGLEAQESWQMRRQMRQILDHWPKSVGSAVARQSRPVGVRRSVLYVATASAAWAQTLAFERLNILRQLNPYLAQPLRDIRFSPAQWTQSADHNPRLRVEGQLRSHPCYTPPAHSQPPLASLPSTPKQSFERWAKAVQQQQQRQIRCPTCCYPCPPGEIQRWSVCALCAVKQWK
ncbi:DUF721 domain-containing protein [Romeria aff. gracilis LEGE 07310]|uniref:DUF721 domain-containing protein n=1 Tax=Vasconcelosia minhoensis LEGE 07310 TaxID=915328 RepID=A0A8J7A9T1_9CYAN|nr:DUF721 domain-containing protein [Romeria gracilis]MBE9076676.1 DUF721 domain-containing protein [Romeria aff. gracilis LEGE 07310]